MTCHSLTYLTRLLPISRLSRTLTLPNELFGPKKVSSLCSIVLDKAKLWYKKSTLY